MQTMRIWAMGLGLVVVGLVLGNSAVFAQQRGGMRYGTGRADGSHPAMQDGSYSYAYPPQFGGGYPRYNQEPVNFVRPIRSSSGGGSRNDDWRSYGGTYSRPRGSGPIARDHDWEDAYGYFGRGYGMSRYRR
ncbi:MAG: hypothetical protein ACKOFW_04300 [Planctomycetaceae bacterium]